MQFLGIGIILYALTTRLSYSPFLAISAVAIDNIQVIRMHHIDVCVMYVLISEIFQVLICSHGANSWILFHQDDDGVKEGCTEVHRYGMASALLVDGIAVMEPIAGSYSTGMML